MERITTEELMYNLDISQVIFGKVDEFGCWYLEIILSDLGTHFTSTEFQDECKNRGVRLTLAAPEHQDMNGKVEGKWITLLMNSHLLMVHELVSETYIHFMLMYTVDHTFQLIPIKYLINEDGEPTMPFKLATGMKPSVLHLRVLFCPCFFMKSYCACLTPLAKHAQ